MELQRRSDNNGNETKRIGPQPAGKAGPVWLSGYSNSHRLFSPDLFGPHPPQADDSSHQHRFCFHWVMLKNHWTLQMLRKYYSYFFLAGQSTLGPSSLDDGPLIRPPLYPPHCTRCLYVVPSYVPMYRVSTYLFPLLPLLLPYLLLPHRTSSLHSLPMPGLCSS